jgi:hypothetical protein
VSQTVTSIVPFETVDAFMAGNGLSWDGLQNGVYGVTLEQIEHHLIASDRALFAAAYMRNPKTIAGSDIVRGEPLVLFPYQVESARCMTSVVHEDGAETGKSIDVSIVILHALMTVEGATGVLGAPEHTHVLEIVDYIEDQMRMNPTIRASVSIKRRAPHFVFESSIGGKFDLVAAGDYGIAFRGIHAATVALFDEAAVVVNDAIWNEFMRAIMPGCALRVYSVPNGRRDTRFFVLCQLARGETVNRKKMPGDGVSLDEYSFRHFHWPKTIMPAPFWTPERAAYFVKLFNGKTSSGYVHNVLGEWGDPENPLFPTRLWNRLHATLPQYRVIGIVGDEADDRLEVSVERIDREQLADRDAKTGAPAVFGAVAEQEQEEVLSITELRDDTDHSPVVDLLRPLVGVVEPGLYFAGGDLGKQRDPSEMTVIRKKDGVYTMVLRLSMKGVPYDLQADLMEALRQIYDLASFGYDKGNAGTAVEGDINRRHKDLAEIASAQLFTDIIPDLDEEGEVIVDEESGEERKSPLRDVGVRVIQGLMKNRTYRVPADPEVDKSFTTYTAKEGTRKNLIYSKAFDHIVDSAVQAFVAYFKENAAVSFVAGGSYTR